MGEGRAGHAGTENRGSGVLDVVILPEIYLMRNEFSRLMLLAVLYLYMRIASPIPDGRVSPPLVP